MRWLPLLRLMVSSFSTAPRLPRSHTNARLLSAAGVLATCDRQASSGAPADGQQCADTVALLVRPPSTTRSARCAALPPHLWG